MGKKLGFSSAILFLAVLGLNGFWASSSSGLADDGPPRDGGRPGGFGGPGGPGDPRVPGPGGPRFGPDGMQGIESGPGGAASASGGLGSVKSQIRASDEEWKIIEPKLRKVIAARQAMETGMNAGESGDIGGRRGGFGGFGGPPGQGRGPGGPGGPVVARRRPFGRDSFSGPNDVGAGGFGPPGSGSSGFGPPGFGPPGFGPGQPASPRESRRDGDDTSARRGAAKPDTARSSDG